MWFIDRDGQTDLAQVRPMIIAGHQRSGTTLMVRLLSAHPQAFITHEFYNFIALNRSFAEHMRDVRTNWLSRPIIRVPNRWGRKGHLLNSILFVRQYRRTLKRCAGQVVDLEAVRRSLHEIAPWARLVGDKVANYVFDLDDLVPLAGLRVVVIYRDCRDVVRSSLQLAQTSWKDKDLGRRLATPEHAAASWVASIEVMEKHRDRVFPIRYEELVTHPQQVLDEIGGFLGIDGQLFRASMIKSDRIGKHKSGMSSTDLDRVIGVAGPTMRRLGYL